MGRAEGRVARRRTRMSQAVAHEVADEHAEGHGEEAVAARQRVHIPTLATPRTGSRSGPEQSIDGLGQRRLGHLAGPSFEDPALRVDEERRRHPPEADSTGDIPGGIGPRRIGEAGSGGELDRILTVVLVIHADEPHLAVEPLGGGGERRHLTTARPTPRRPEVHDERGAPQIVTSDASLAIQRWKVEFEGRLTGDGDRSVVRRPAGGDGQRGDGGE